MAKKPLNLDWDELLSGRDEPPPPEVVVVADAADGGVGAETVQGDARMLAEISDPVLEEKINRAVKNLASPMLDRLPDRGEKLRSMLRKFHDKRDQRTLAKIKKDNGICEKARQCNIKETSDLFSEFSLDTAPCKPDSQSSFAFTFTKKLEGKADAAFSKELSFISQEKHKSLKKSGEQRHEGFQPPRMSSQRAKRSFTDIPSLCFYSEVKKRIPSGDQKDRVSNLSLHEGRTLPRHFSKRKRISELQDSLDLEFKKIEDVVLLDDEDIEPVQSTQGDTHNEWKETKIYYPSREDPECVELTYSDIKCLNPESYLSSPIMNFYVQYLQRSLSYLGRPSSDYYIFNTYFYKKLEEAVSSKVCLSRAHGNDDDSVQFILAKGDHISCFLKLRRWWKGVDIFQKAYIFLPVHGDLHWSLVIICIPSKEDESGPIILHLDSLGIHPSGQIFDTIGSYLKEEWNYVNQNAPPPDHAFSDRIWRHLPCRIQKERVKVPQQKNEYDCGLFVLYFMERFIREAPERLRKEDLDRFDRKWFKPEEASGLRKRVQKLLLEEFESARLEDGKESSTSSASSESDSN
ncbi:ubiquitin-like-specific protease 1D isoform X2 [Phoenix dactylifera]|uniref:Ubiquitin-like-specific protease 1D isoform X2 n=1 Tax=Phoenix dactylifera TaxID=42345 RepID=A0A8B9AEA2_PHODC|nr:ubiquitin-like-specific protease 1D isoform X2 [Phoenix dactylifera]